MYIERYEHHGMMVYVQESLKGKHRAHCLCYQSCNNFKPNMPDNCTIAQDNYKQCVKHNIVTAVYECPKYIPRESSGL